MAYLKGIVVAMTIPDTIKEKQKPNRLINEMSPYLLQHAYNPVNWYPWGEEAFTKAKKKINKSTFHSDIRSAIGVM